MDEKKVCLLQLNKITKIFSRNTVDEVKALKEVCLDVHDGDYVTIIGSNGAGKTTMFNVIGGVFPPERGGNISVNGTNVTGMSEYQHAAYVGRVYQDPNIGTAPRMTIEENMALALLRGKTRGFKQATGKKNRELFRAALAPLGLGLEDRLNALVGTLSSGQRQAVALVMATLSKPPLLLLDEHIANLDPRTAQLVLDLTEIIIKREKITTLMITHNMEMALKYGNRLIMMHEGKIIVDLNHEQRIGLTVNDLVRAFEKAAGKTLTDEKILLREQC